MASHFLIFHLKLVFIVVIQKNVKRLAESETQQAKRVCQESVQRNRNEEENFFVPITQSAPLQTASIRGRSTSRGRHLLDSSRSPSPAQSKWDEARLMAIQKESNARINRLVQLSEWETELHTISIEAEWYKADAERYHAESERLQKETNECKKKTAELQLQIVELEYLKLKKDMDKWLIRAEFIFIVSNKWTVICK